MNKISEKLKSVGSYVAGIFSLEGRVDGALMILLAIGIIAVGKWGEAFLCLVLAGMGLKRLLNG